jgi:hypothetical protein
MVIWCCRASSTVAQCEGAVARIEQLLQERPVPAGHAGHHFFFEPAEAEPLLMAMLTQTSAWELAAELVAPLELVARPQVQVALNFLPYDHRPGRGHIDGITPPDSDGRPGTFTLPAGIVLTDQTCDDMGNLTVWLGTHVRTAEYLQAQGADSILATGGHPPVEHDEPVQIHAAAGDLLLASYLLSHNTGRNVSDVIRKTLYYRLHVNGHQQHWREAVTDALAEFPAVRASSAQHERISV